MRAQGSVVGGLGVISKVILCAGSESSRRIGPPRKDIEIFEVKWPKNPLE